ncbi:MAG: ATP-binding protein [Devosia sp. 67-54]|uniref:ATP-binding protein n=1 Tax=unclassified Devosia TaxID=196773 RepID=UPI000968B3AB|nr:MULTISPECIES: ATP-binding protein [unclassified Devosia]MBN9306920.1 ATP-binding protein [Devosia sp.]OJX16984.1 MAG: ATP-binding protein [Devosia sp. 67-54]
MADKPPIRAKDRDTIIRALRAGVVPRLGLQHIQVGRKREIEALVSDIDRVGDGGSTVRFIIGTYGAGKTFFLFLVRQIALQKKLAVMQADLGPDKRIHATGGQAQTLYSELVKSLATRAFPDGGALRSMIESFISDTADRAQGRPIVDAITARLAPLREMISGPDFAAVIAAYARGFDEGNEPLQEAALRWLRGEYTTKTQAREDLGVRTIIDDSSFYDALRLWARFSRLAGYGGLLVCLDEMVNLYKLQNAQARKLNYEQILHILNDALQGTTEGLGIVFGGTPDFLMDTRRGLYSYEALQSRLAENSFASSTLIDLGGPVIHLQNLSVEELWHLLEKLRDVFALNDTARYLVPDEALDAFLDHCRSRIGDAYFQTPRNSIKSFVDLLAILEQNPGSSWREMLGAVQVDRDEQGLIESAVPPDEADGDDLATLRL